MPFCTDGGFLQSTYEGDLLLVQWTRRGSGPKCDRDTPCAHDIGVWFLLRKVIQL